MATYVVVKLGEQSTQSVAVPNERLIGAFETPLQFVDGEGRLLIAFSGGGFEECTYRMGDEEDVLIVTRGGVEFTFELLNGTKGDWVFVDDRDRFPVVNGGKILSRLWQDTFRNPRKW